MKTNRIPSFLLALLCCTALHATTYEYNNFTFDVDVASQTATLIQKSSGSYSGNIVIPETFTGPKNIEYTVTAIGANALKNCSGVTAVSIPVTVSSIGANAFYGCSGLTSIPVPALVDNIGESAFYGCSALSSIDLPSVLTSLSRNLFYGCTSLSTIRFNQALTSIGDYAFYNCSRLSSLSLPSKLKTIGAYAFSGCTSLSSLTLPSSVTSVGSYSFNDCSAMSKLTLSKNLQTIGDHAFYRTSSLSVLTVPASVTSIGTDAFAGSGVRSLTYAADCTVARRTYATAVTSVSLPASLTSIAEKAFYDCQQLAGVTLPHSLTSIGASAFYNCASLSAVTIPASVTSIGTDAFAGSGVSWLEYADGCTTALRTYATGITSVTIPASVASFAANAFLGCNIENIFIFNVEMWNYIFSKLTYNPFPAAHRLYVEGNLLTALNADFGRDISNYAFYGCKELRQVNLTGSITGVQAYAFTQCPDLEAVAMAGSVAYIGQDAFQGCSNLQAVRLGSGLQTIGKNAFYACTKLNSVLMGPHVTQIGEAAFKGCSGLPSLELPPTLVSIGTEAFSGCHELAAVDIPAGVSQIAAKTFYDCKNLQQAVLSDAVTSISSYAFYGCRRLRTMHFPNATSTFGERCFSDCDSLRYVYLGTGVGSISAYAFANSKFLTGFYIETATPPACDSNAFSGSEPEWASLYVPDESVSLYSGKSPWSSFGTQTGQSSAPVYVTSITLSPSVVIVEEGDPFSLSASVTPANATNKKVNWTSSNTAVAYVNAKGTGLANVQGRTTITATAADNNGASAKSIVIVSNSFVPLSGVTLATDSLGLAEGRELQLTAETSPANATFSELTWMSTNPQVAQVNAVGMVKALKAGSAVITCTASDGRGAQAECKLTVTEAVDPTIGDANEDGSVSVADLAYAVHVIMEELAAGADISLYDVDGDGEITTDDVLAIAGLILGRTPEAILKLIEIPAQNLTLGVDETRQIGCTVIPHRYASAVEWSSSAPEVASVSSDGTVTGLMVGTAVITATATDGSGLTATCVVTVDGSYGSTDGHAWVDLGLPSGTHWATQNVGALSASEYGGYYAWGETAEKTVYDWPNYAHCDGSATTLTKYCNAASKGTRDDILHLQATDDAAAAEWGGIWCMPTREQFDELFNPQYTTSVWTEQNGFYGRLVTSRVNGRSIFLPAAGYKKNAALTSSSTGGYYATRDLYESDADYNYSLNFGSASTTDDNHTYRCYGQSVRPVFASYIQMSQKSLDLEPGSTATLTATVISTDGIPGEVTWSSSDSSVATVSSEGVVTGVSEGMAMIYASAEDRLVGYCQVTVGLATKTFTVTGNGKTVTFKMKLVEAGTFQMGSTSGDSDEQPVHSVTLTKNYYMGETEVTQALWYAVMGQKPTSGSQWSSTYGLGDNNPAYYVSWNDCLTFITKLNALTGVTFRLPTEAEWEFAAKGGRNSNGYTYAGSNTLGDVAWYSSNSNSKTHEVGTKAANELGLYDMNGNVWEWCQDWYGSSYYSSSPSTDPTGPASGSHRVGRGGGWSDSANGCRVANRFDFTDRFYGLGLRLALGGAYEESSPYLTVSPSSLEFEVNASWQEVYVSTNNDYAISTSDSWITATASSDRKTITVQVTENPSTNSRTGTVTLTSGDVSATISITQRGAEGLGADTKSFTVTGNGKTVTFNMKLVEAGTFQMGSTSGESDEKPVHSVTLTKNYYMGETEVTQALWYAVMGQSPTSGGSQWSSTYGLGDNNPAYDVSWNDCQTFITKLNALTGVTFRLPSEAEWEFAAKGGKKSKGNTYAGSNTIGDVAWYYDNSYALGSSSSDYGTHAVGTKAANELGLYDMSGNVLEWCQDRYGSSYYSSSPSTDPTGPTSGSYRVYHGGSWRDFADYCRVAYRDGDYAANRYGSLGLRLAL